MSTVGGAFIDKHNNKRQELNKISTLNSGFFGNFAANEVFQGEGEEVLQFGRAGIAISSTSASNGTLTIEVSHDRITWGGPRRSWADTRRGQPIMWNIVEKYFRIKYVNGLKSVKNLSIQTHYSVTSGVLLGHQLNAPLSDETAAIITKSILVGKDENSIYHNVRATSDGKLQIDTDKFAHLQVESLATLKRISKYLEIISGYELIGKDEDI